MIAARSLVLLAALLPAHAAFHPADECPVATDVPAARLVRTADGAEGRDALVALGPIGLATGAQGEITALVMASPHLARLAPGSEPEPQPGIEQDFGTFGPPVGPLAVAGRAFGLWWPSEGMLRIHGPDAKVLREVSLAELAASRRRDAAIDDQGRLHLADTLHDRQTLFVHDIGTRIDTVRLPISAYRRRFAPAVTDGPVTIRRNIPFHPEPRWAVAPDGRIAWSDGENVRVTLVTDGTVTRTLACVGDARAPVGDDERADHRERIVTVNRTVDSTWRWSGPDVPDHHARIEGLRFDARGRLWVMRPVASVPIPDAERRAPMAGLHAPRWERRWHARVFEADGRPVGEMALPRGTEPSQLLAVGDTVWTLEAPPGADRLRLERYAVAWSGEARPAVAGERGCLPAADPWRSHQVDRVRRSLDHSASLAYLAESGLRRPDRRRVHLVDDPALCRAAVVAINRALQRPDTAARRIHLVAVGATWWANDPTIVTGEFTATFILDSAMTRVLHRVAG